jgi:hypothetical protein
MSARGASDGYSRPPRPDADAKRHIRQKFIHGGNITIHGMRIANPATFFGAAPKPAGFPVDIENNMPALPVAPSYA